MPKRLNTARELGWHMGRSLGYQIKERDCLTRFSHAWGPLCRWPELTVEQVRDRVHSDLERVAALVGEISPAKALSER